MKLSAVNKADEAILTALGPEGRRAAGDSLGLSLPPGSAHAVADHFAAHWRAYGQGGGMGLAAWDEGGGLAALALYRPSPWDSDYFGVGSGFLDALYCRRPQDWNSFLRQLLALLRGRGEVFITRKTPAHLSRELAALQEAGFRVCDTQISLGYFGPAAPVVSGGDFTVRVMAPGEQDRLAGLRLQFNHNRFSGDPRIGEHQARGVWEQAQANSPRGLAELVMVVESGRRPVGMIAVQGVRPPAGGPMGGNLFLVGVEREYWGGGAFAALLTGTMRQALNRHAWLMVDTSVSNYRAINAYLKHGFTRAIQTKASLHLWLDGPRAERMDS